MPEILIENWKIYDPSKIDDSVLRDDWRIVHAWLYILEEKKERFTSPQFTDYSLEEQKRIVHTLKRKIEKEMKNRGFEIQEELAITKGPEEVEVIKPETRNLEEIDDKYVKTLNDLELKELDKELHKIYRKIRKVTEPLANAHIFTWSEMRNRGIKHTIQDPLTDETALEVVEYPKVSSDIIKLDEALEAFPQDILVKEDPVFIYLAGRIVNEQWIPSDHDIDLIVKYPYPDRRIVEAIISGVYRNNPEIAKRLHITFDPEGPIIGLTVPLYRISFSQVSKKEQHRRSPWSYLANLTICTPLFQKPKSGFHKFEFFKIDDLWQKWGIDHLDHGIYINKKYDGMSFFICRDGDKVKIITEDRKRDRANVFKKSVEELLKKSKSRNFAINAEMIWYKDKEFKHQYRREEMIPWVTSKKELDDELIRFHVHDCIWFENKSLVNEGYKDRYQTLQKILSPGMKHWELIPADYVETKEEFIRATKKYRKVPGSEGIIAKDAIGKYSLRGRTGQMVKLKNLKEIDVIVWKETRKKTAEGKPLDQWVYECAFRVPCPMVDRIKKTEVIRKKGICYAKIGTSYSTGVRAKVGDIIIVRPIQILENKDKEGKLYWTWMFPYFEGKHAVKKEPDTLTTVRRIIKVGTGPLEQEKASVPGGTLVRCPYYDNGRICILKERFIAPIALRKQSLRFPIRCKLASIYRCPYVKRYYYEETSRTLDFVLHKHYGNPRMDNHWDIRWKVSSKEKHEIHLRENPIGRKRVNAYLFKKIRESPESVESWMVTEGKHLPRNVRGVGKTFIDVLDSGKVEVEEKEKEISLSFQGKYLKGNYLLKKEEKGWSLTREEEK